MHGVVALFRDTGRISLFSQYFAAFKMFLGGNLGSECVASSQYKRCEAGTYETGKADTAVSTVLHWPHIIRVLIYCYILLIFLISTWAVCSHTQIHTRIHVLKNLAMTLACVWTCCCRWLQPENDGKLCLSKINSFIDSLWQNKSILPSPPHRSNSERTTVCMCSMVSVLGETSCAAP